ncbi:unnamed protein product [Adineta steineri]|uniref:EF-hand domain-containing protein n=1 Tax=Adineta steineri TaxID=433720 RepID=A0A814AK86_9BILA|nr:unnamed protein product [Adineta steineri]CAF3485309.1 unnamed protein product [Adineta steineri]
MAETRRSRLHDDVDNEQFDQEMQDFNEIFSRFKDDPDVNSINVNHLTEILQAFGRNPSLKDSQERVNELELVGKYELTLEDVLTILDEPWTTVNNDHDTLHRALKKFDETQEGYIDVEHFRKVMSTLGEPLSEKEVDDLIELGLQNDDQKIDIDYLLVQLLGNHA